MEINMEITPDSTIHDVGDIETVFDALNAVALAVIDQRNVLYLLSFGEDLGPFYIGIPFERDEDGVDVDPHRGFFNSPEYHQAGDEAPVFPLRILATGTDV